MREIPELDNLTHYKTWLLVGRVDAKCHHLLTTGLSEVGLSVAQYEVLHAIYRDEGLSQQRLARKLLVAKSNVTVLAQRLESNGLIRRERDPHDDRERHPDFDEFREFVVARAHHQEVRLVGHRRGVAHVGPE